MNLDGTNDEIELLMNGDEIYIHNLRTNSIPTVIHSNSSTKV